MRECKEEISNMIKKLEATLNAQTELLEITEEVSPAYKADDALLKRQQSTQKQPHKVLLSNNHQTNQLFHDVKDEKINSKKKIDFNVDKAVEKDDELYKVMIQMRKRSETLFKNLIASQMNFNETLNNNIFHDREVAKKTFGMHMEFIEKTCKYEKGVESLYSIDNDVCENINIKGVDQFKKAFNDLAKGSFATRFKANIENYENHPHLLTSQQQCRETMDISTPQTLQTGTIDPYTKQLITKPIKNKHCQHVYDESSVDLMFQQRLFISCPYIGCTNNRFTKKDLLSVHNIL